MTTTNGSPSSEGRDGSLMQEMVECLPLIAWVHDASGDQVFVNDTFCAFFGVTREGMKGHRWQSLLHPDDAERYLEAFEVSIRERGDFHEVARVRRADGEWRWLESWGRPRFTDSGEFGGMVGTSADVTERRATEEALARANQRVAEQAAQLRAVYDAMADGLIVFDDNGRAVLVNEANARLLGFESGTELRWTLPQFADLFELREPGGEPLPVEAWPAARVMRGERIADLELTARRRDTGQEWVFSYNGEPVLDGEGEQILSVLVTRDVTARSQWERQVRESEERFRTLADNMSQLAWMADENGWIFWYNERWYEYTGTTLEEVRGWGWKKLHHPDHVSRVVRRIKHSWDTGEPWEDVFPLRGRDGSYRWFLSRAQPIRNGDGEIIRWFGTNTDVTEQREAEERLREADRRKDEYIAMLGHELRNPLSAIQSATELVKARSSLDSSLGRAAGVLARQSAHMARLVDGLLEASRIARGTITLDAEALDLRVVCREVLGDRHSGISEEGLELDLRLPSEPVWVRGDRVRLVQVMENLLANAQKFTPAPGRITVALESEEDRAVLEIRDTGVGIDPDRLDDIFSPFHQEAPDVARTTGGLGLGLALCRGLVELHGGSIDARSGGRGSGSQFIVRLPLVASGEACGEEAVDRGGAPRRVLIVEDNLDVAEMLQDVLVLHGHEVWVAGTAHRALDVMRREEVDVVFCDIGLPGMSGYDFARAVRRDADIGQTTLVALTGYGQPEDRRRSEDAGFDTHLVKPVGVDALEEVLRAPASR